MKSFHIGYLIILLVSIIIIIGCEDDPVSNQADHFKAIGTVVYDATGALSVSILRGVTTDTLYIDEGVLSDHFEVKFYDDSENIIECTDKWKCYIRPFNPRYIFNKLVAASW